MREFSKLLGLLFALVTGVADAAPVRFDFTALIFDVQLNTASQPLLGSTVSGTIKYDSEKYDTGLVLSPNSDHPTYYEYFPKNAAITADINGSSYRSDITNISVLNDFQPLLGSFLDRLFFAADPTAKDPWMQLWMDSLDPSTPSPLLDSIALPLFAPDLSLAERSSSPFAFRSDEMIFTALLTSFTNSHPVSEPGTLSLACLALAGLAFRSARSSKRTGPLRQTPFQ